VAPSGRSDQTYRARLLWVELQRFGHGSANGGNRRNLAIGVRIGEGPLSHPQPTFGCDDCALIKIYATRESPLKNVRFRENLSRLERQRLKPVKCLAKLILDFNLAKGESTVEFREGS
jgi:hypothetical protein